MSSVATQIEAPKVAHKADGSAYSQGYDPRKFRRQVRQAGQTVDGVKPFTVKSLTRDDGTRHNCGVDIRTGAVFCDCEHFSFKLQHKLPTLSNAALWCKHVKQSVEGMARRKELRLIQDGAGNLVGAVVRYDAPPVNGSRYDHAHEDYLGELEIIQRECREDALRELAEGEHETEEGRYQEAEWERQAGDVARFTISESEGVLRGVAMRAVFRA